MKEFQNQDNGYEFIRVQKVLDKTGLLIDISINDGIGVHVNVVLTKKQAINLAVELLSIANKD